MCCGNSSNGNFTYIAFASDLNGSNFSVNRNSGNMKRCYQALYVSNIELDINSPTFQNYFYNRWFNLCEKEKDIFIIEFQKFVIYKRQGNLNLKILEIGDIVCGFLDNSTFLPHALYLGGDTTDINSFSVNPIEDIP